MFCLRRKFIAVLMLLWLPVFTGNALAASVSMQLHPGSCEETAASQAMHDRGEHHQHHGEKHAANDESNPSCNTCSVCHLACTGYLVVPKIEMVTVQATVREITPYLVVPYYITSAPLVPPPLASA
ncbi:MAG: DUF2946 family protein [Betaproteobacteria bacterium]|jgi:hypothetical protein|nr:DUF2946 family protein [Betaproteobacteria bacterium]